MDGISGSYGAQAAAGANAGENKSVGAVLRDLKKQYPDLKLSAQSFGSEAAVKSYAMKQTGKYNVAIHPQALANMGSDPEIAANLHESLGRVKDADDRLERMVNARGASLVASGTIVNEKGEITGGWAVSQTTTEGAGLFASSKKDSPEELMKKLDEKRQERRAEEKRLEKKRLADAEKAEQAAGESLEVNVSVEVNAAAAQAPAPSGNVDFTA